MLPMFWFVALVTICCFLITVMVSVFHFFILLPVPSSGSWGSSKAHYSFSEVWLKK